jgi:hypothetical protein
MGLFVTPWRSHCQRSSGAFRGGQKKGEAAFAFRLISPLDRHRTPCEAGLAPARFTFQYMPPARPRQGWHFHRAHRYPKDFLQQQ